MTDKRGIYTRYIIIVLFIVVVCVAIFYKMSRTIFVERDDWRHKSDSVRYDTTLVPAMRGDILAADGRLLASAVLQYNLYVDAKILFANKWEDAKKTKVDTLFEGRLDTLCMQLSEILGDRTPAEYERHLRAGLQSDSPHFYRLSKKRVSHLTLLQLLDCKIFNQRNQNKSGFIVTGEDVVKIVRERPFGDMARSTLGGLKRDGWVGYEGSGHGVTGLELTYDSLLYGADGEKVRMRARMYSMSVDKTIREPIPGKDLVTTLDVDIQDMLESSLKNRLIDVDADYGTAVIMEVETGAIRAMANLNRDANGQYSEGMNHAVCDLIEPGSTIKTVSMMIALDSGVVRPDDIIDTGNGVYRYGGREIRDHNWRRGGYGELTAAQTIWYSSNVGISKIILKGFEHRPADFIDAIYARGLNKKIDIPLPIHHTIRPEIKHPKKDGKPNPTWWKTSLPWMSFGYETSFPPIYTLMFYNAIANNGKMVKPYLVAGISENGEMIEEYETEVITEQICKPQTLKEIHQMLLGVVEHGTARGANSASSDYVQIAGKSGTAQIYDEATGRHTNRHRVSFCGYFPAENPQYTCIVVVSNPRKGFRGSVPCAVLRETAEQMYARGFLGGENSLPVDSVSVKMPRVKKGDYQATKIVCEELDLTYVSPADDARWVSVTSRDHTMAMEEYTPRSYLIPSVVGMGASDALYLLESYGLRVGISGSGKVVQQSIPVGSRVRKGDYIRIVLK